MSRYISRIAAAAFIGLAGFAQSAAAQEADVYVAAEKNESGQVFLSYVYSDSSTGAFTPVDATGIWITGSYSGDPADFNPQADCGWNHDFPTTIDAKFQAAPVYGPGSSQGAISPFDLPSFMAREGARVLLAEGLVADETEAAPYFNCAGFVWAEIMSQPEETWREILKSQGQ